MISQRTGDSTVQSVADCHANRVVTGSCRPARICYLANPLSTHTAKWVNHFCSKGYEVHLVGFERPRGILPEVSLHTLKSWWPSSLRYFAVQNQLQEILNEVHPDLLHAHYASGYGTLGRLARFHPYILSVWGSDVFELPIRSPMVRSLIKKNLASADHVCSTSHVMANHVRQYCHRPITVTPFGVDCDRFKPGDSSAGSGEELVIGTVKSLDPEYGIDCLIKSFALLSRRYGHSMKLRLVIAGEGAEEKELRQLADNLGVGELTEFVGFVPQEKLPRLLRHFSLFVALSVFEAFGVSILEASAAGLPVIVSDGGGFREVVQQGITGLMVPAGDPKQAAEAMATLLENESLRRKMGAAGRKFVLENYEWHENASRMERLYQSFLHPQGTI